MPLIAITSRENDTIIYQGHFPDMKSCVEQAVAEGCPLTDANLSFCNLVNANLDEGHFSGATFEGSSLMGANMSDCSFNGTDFCNTSLQGCCFAFSHLENCIFDGASFGGTDISGAAVKNCRFSTLSGLALNFIDASSISGCRFIDNDGKTYDFGKPPVYISGLRLPVIMLDSHLKIGAKIKSYREWRHERIVKEPQFLT